METGGRHARAPRIGVSWVRAEAAATDRYVRAVRAAGGEPVPLLAEADSWKAALGTLDGLVLTGGNAIDPRRYGEENHGLCRVVIPDRDDLELEALQWCLDRALPVLGICRGMQFINVAQGGSMLQDLASTTIEHEDEGERSRFHPVEVVPGTRLAAVAGAHKALQVNSRHHQGLRVQHLAPGLGLSALAPDGVVEGLEARDGRFLVGVQFHPEYQEEVPHVTQLFAVLVAQCRAHAGPG
jgi:putative glutamine amidotransferase